MYIVAGGSCSAANHSFEADTTLYAIIFSTTNDEQDTANVVFPPLLL